MIEVISSTTQKAKKVYDDEGWEFLCEWDGYIPEGKKITFGEKRLMALWRKDRWLGRKILPGDLYVRQFNKYEGTTYTWRSKKAIFDLVCKLELFPDI